MNEKHSSKTISFLMELIFVLFFFTIASAISVFVIVQAKNKNDHAIAIRSALLYGENMIAEKEIQRDIRSFLYLDQFYLDDKGNPNIKSGTYKVEIQRFEVSDLTNWNECIMIISKNDTSLTTLSFLLEKEANE